MKQCKKVVEVWECVHNGELITVRIYEVSKDSYHYDKAQIRLSDNKVIYCEIKTIGPMSLDFMRKFALNNEYKWEKRS